jgi:hypothetical protein
MQRGRDDVAERDITMLERLWQSYEAIQAARAALDAIDLRVLPKDERPHLRRAQADADRHMDSMLSIIHRLLKPSRISIERYGRAYVAYIEIKIARLAHDAPPLTPEQVTVLRPIIMRAKRLAEEAGARQTSDSPPEATR